MTGVQTCALPISGNGVESHRRIEEITTEIWRPHLDSHQEAFSFARRDAALLHLEGTGMKESLARNLTPNLDLSVASVSG